MKWDSLSSCDATFIVHCQHFGCWLPGAARSQGIGRHGIDLVLPKYSGFSIRRIEFYIHVFNTLRLRQNGRHFPDNIFKCIFLNGNVWILINDSLKFVPRGPINNIPAMAQIMAWCWPGDKPLSEQMMVSLLMYICVTRPQWVNISVRVDNIVSKYHDI